MWNAVCHLQLQLEEGWRERAPPEPSLCGRQSRGGSCEASVNPLGSGRVRKGFGTGGLSGLGDWAWGDWRRAGPAAYEGHSGVGAPGSQLWTPVPSPNVKISPSTGTEHSESMLLAGRIVAFSTKDKRKNNPDECTWRGSSQNNSSACKYTRTFFRKVFIIFPFGKHSPTPLLDVPTFLMGLTL